MQSFEFQHRTRVVCGAQAIQRLGPLAKELGASRILIVSDLGVVKAGHFDKGLASIRKSGLEATAFHDLHPNPTTHDVNAATELARSFKPDLIVGLGGGSSMDCAKGMNFLYSCGGQMRDYWGVGKATGPMLPMIAVPTTAGTGSEAQSFALISDSQTHVKMACGDKRALPAIAILDPELTVTQPAHLTALTGIDALTHALESYVTKTRNPMSMAFAKEAWERLSKSFAGVLKTPTDLGLRSEMQLGAYLSGMAIEASMLGAAHALANPITAAFDVPHGQAVGMMMPHVLRANARNGEVNSLYGLLVACLRVDRLDGSTYGEQLGDWFTSMLFAAGLKTQLRELSVDRSDLAKLADDALPQWTLQHNPILYGRDELISIYESAF